MSIQVYLILGVLIVIGIMSLIIFLQSRSNKQLRADLSREKEEKIKAQAAQKKMKENIEAVLDYEKQDAVLVQQRESHVETLVKTRSKGTVEDEVKTLFNNVRDAYNSLPVD